MNHRRHLSAFFAAALLLPALLPGTAVADVYDEHNNNDTTLSRIEGLWLKQTGATPVVRLRASGDQYDTVAAQGFPIEYEGRAACRGAWDLHWLKVEMDDTFNSFINEPKEDSGLYAKTYIPWGKDSGSRERSFSDALGAVVPHAKVAKDGYKLCNDALESRIKSGMSRDEALNQEVTFLAKDRKNPPFHIEAYLHCGDTGGDPKFTHSWQKVKIDYVCAAKPLPPTTRPADTRPPVVKLEPKLKVTDVDLKLSPPQHSGACPAEIKLEGRIVASRDGEVNYRWESATGAKSKTYTQVFAAAGSRDVSTLVKIGKKVNSTIGDLKNAGELDDESESANGQYNGSFKLVVLSPTPEMTATAGYQVQCLAAQPDLQPGKTFNIGGKSVANGGTVNLTLGDISGTVDGDCLFKFAYEHTNKSAFPAEGYSNII